MLSPLCQELLLEVNGGTTLPAIVSDQLPGPSQEGNRPDWQGDEDSRIEESTWNEAAILPGGGCK